MTLQETSAPTPMGREKKGHAMRGIIVGLTIVALSLVLASCAQKQHKQLESDLGYDALYKAMKKEEQDFVKARAREDQMQRRQEQLEAAIQPVLPEFNPLDETTISISVQEETLHNVLYIIARNAGLNLIIEPGISLDNRVTISFEDAQSSLVVDKLLQAYDLAWEVKENVLYVNRFVEKVFDLDFVNTKTEVTTKAGGDIFGGALAAAGGGGAGDLSGEFKVDTSLKSKLEDDSLYGVLEKGVKKILEGGAAGATPDQIGMFSLDPVAGQLMVRTTPGKMRAIARMINNLKTKLSRQVVIDARILEVRLSDEFSLGIDWNWVSRRLAFEHPLTVNYVGHNTLKSITGSNQNDIVTIAGKVGDDTINSAIQAMQTFGGIKIVANPHVRAKHGQPALFTSGSSQKYVSEIKRDTDTNGNITFSVTTSTVFNGVMLGVVAYIGDDNKIDMQIYPIKSEVDSTSLALTDVTAAGDKITLPKVDVKNVMSTVRVNPGDVIILGGLIDKTTGKTDAGIPGLSDIPILGWAFKGRSQTEAVRELVIIMDIRVVE
jgi:MSHA type pilus biogenesis protein MshL